VTDSGSSCDRRQRGCRPAAHSSPARYANERQHLASQRALPFFCQQLFERGVVEHRFRQQPLQLAVLVFQRPQPLGFGYFHAAVLGLPVVKRHFGDAVLARQVARLRSSLARSRRTVIICSSVNLPRFMVRPPAGPDSNPPWRKNSVAGQLLALLFKHQKDKIISC
jgi:hypothetical protein